MAQAVGSNAPSTRQAASSSPSAIVEQAPYRPKKGTLLGRRAKVVLMHWLSRSPPKMQPSWAAVKLPLAKTRSRAMEVMRLSAFSQLCSPKVLSSLI